MGRHRGAGRRRLASLATLIGPPELGADRSRRRRHADEIDKLIVDWTSRRTVAEAVATLRQAELGRTGRGPAAELLADEHLAARGFWEAVDHPVAGRFKTTGLPFTFASRPRHWIPRGAVYGQHTVEVMTDVLGSRRGLRSPRGGRGDQPPTRGTRDGWRSPCASTAGRRTVRADPVPAQADSTVLELTSRHRITAVDWDPTERAVAIVVEITDPATSRPVDVRFDVVETGAAGTGRAEPRTTMIGGIVRDGRQYDVLGTYLGVVADEN